MSKDLFSRGPGKGDRDRSAPRSYRAGYDEINWHREPDDGENCVFGAPGCRCGFARRVPKRVQSELPFPNA